jgi:hypothetical protein
VCGYKKALKWQVYQFLTDEMDTSLKILLKRIYFSVFVCVCVFYVLCACVPKLEGGM